MFSVSVPAGAGHTHAVAMIRAALTARKHVLGAEPARKPQKPSKPPTLAKVIKQAKAAGIEVARYEVKPDGSIVVVTDTGEQQQGNEVDEWIAKHARAPEKH
jgi:hypothetical protein